MKNRIVGFLIIGIALLIGIIIWIFNTALTTIVETSCSHGSTCPMWGTIETQTYISIVLMAFVFVIGLYLVFFGKEEVIITKFKTVKAPVQQVQQKKINAESFREVLGKLDSEERDVLEKIIAAEGTIFQSDLVEKTGLNKVKVTRLLDRLEGKALIERRRRGMTNVIILKH